MSSAYWCSPCSPVFSYKAKLYFLCRSFQNYPEKKLFVGLWDSTHSLSNCDGRLGLYINIYWFPLNTEPALTLLAHFYPTNLILLVDCPGHYWNELALSPTELYTPISAFLQVWHYAQLLRSKCFCVNK